MEIKQSLSNNFLHHHETGIVVAFCAVAVLRILTFSAAFPFFNPQDEQAHFDLVVKYSHGYLPRRQANLFSRESAELIALYGSLEYLTTGTARGEIQEKPFWTGPIAAAAPLAARRAQAWMRLMNYEAFSFPLYYVVAGGWYALGSLTHMPDGWRLYSVRFLNAILYAMFMAVAYRFCWFIMRTDSQLCFAVLSLLAVFPQDVFYGINSDVLSPLVVAAALYGLALLMCEDRGAQYFGAVGILVAAGSLVKLTNMALLLPVMAYVVLSIMRRWCRRGELRSQWPKLLLFLTAALLPLAGWLSWNAYAVGDSTGTNLKITQLGWTRHSFQEICHHPIFSPGGFLYFMGELTKRFWRGELVWRRLELRSFVMDGFFLISSALFIPAAMVAAGWDPLQYEDRFRMAQRMNSIAVLSGILLLAVLSTFFDFHDCVNPSRAHPYFVSGRLISGILLPVICLYIDGFHRILRKIGWPNGLLIGVIGISLMLGIWEATLYLPIFSSPYNLFHFV